MSQWRKHNIDEVAAGSHHDGAQSGHPKSHDAHNEPNPRRKLHGGVDVVATLAVLASRHTQCSRFG